MDIRGEQYGVGVEDVECSGIFPVITTAPMALYYEGKIESDSEMDEDLALLDLDQGVEMSTDWWR